MKSFSFSITRILGSFVFLFFSFITTALIAGQTTIAVSDDKKAKEEQAKFIESGPVNSSNAQIGGKPKDDKLIFWPNDKLSIQIGGKFNNEMFVVNNMNFLNASIGADSTFYIRTTFDFFSMFTQGEQDNPRIVFYDALRFRFKWGNDADVKSAMSYASVAGTQLPVSGTSVNKHLVWMRESWLKVSIGENKEHDHYFQIGLIPYQVGRGISLGAAYDVTSFLCLSPGSSIEQYAPAVLLSLNPVADRLRTDFYLALVQNNQTSLTENLAPIHAHELNACPQRGVGRQSFISTLRAEVALYRKEKESVIFEPYIVHQQSPDQDLEFTNDVDSYLTTAGGSLEALGNRFAWGIEGACNFGELDIRAWDRNYNKLGRDGTNGDIIEQYTKVYQSSTETYPVNASTTKLPYATHTNQIQEFVTSCPQDRSSNGQLIGVATVDGTTQYIYNAYDRFRPLQERQFCGYFFVADAAYDCIPKTLNWAVGIGYASGYIEQQRDANKATQESLLNEPYTAFVPLQSIYSGKRLRHLVLFNIGVPRFNVKLPNGDLSQINVTNVLEPNIINEFTNIAFLGTRIDWKVQSLRKYGVNIAQNIIAYWIPETAHYITSPASAGTSPDGTLVTTEPSGNFLGTEFTTEFWVTLYDKIKIYGYVGALMPGDHYRDMCGTLFGKAKLPTGYDIAYIANIGAAYYF